MTQKRRKCEDSFGSVNVETVTYLFCPVALLSQSFGSIFVIMLLLWSFSDLNINKAK